MGKMRRESYNQTKAPSLFPKSGDVDAALYLPRGELTAGGAAPVLGAAVLPLGCCPPKLSPIFPFDSIRACLRYATKSHVNFSMESRALAGSWMFNSMLTGGLSAMARCMRKPITCACGGHQSRREGRALARYQ